MPDLVTHIAVQTGVNQALSNRVLIFGLYLGAVLPDVPKPALRLLAYSEKWFFYPFHSPIFLVVLIYFISLWFVERDRKYVFLGGLIGATVHLALDLMQKTVASYYFLFFPVSYTTWSLSLFEPERSLDLLPLTVSIAGTAIGLRFFWDRYNDYRHRCK